MKDRESRTGGGATGSKGLLAATAILAVAFVILAAVPAGLTDDDADGTVSGGTTLYVGGTNASDSNDGSGEGEALKTIMAALGGGGVTTIKLLGDPADTGEITVPRSVTIESDRDKDTDVKYTISARITTSNNPDLTLRNVKLEPTLETNKQHAVYFASTGTLTVDGCTITLNGTDDIRTNGIYANGAKSASIKNTTFVNAEGTNYTRGMELGSIAGDVTISNNIATGLHVFAATESVATGTGAVLTVTDNRSTDMTGDFRINGDLKDSKFLQLAGTAAYNNVVVEKNTVSAKNTGNTIPYVSIHDGKGATINKMTVKDGGMKVTGALFITGNVAVGGDVLVQDLQGASKASMTISAGGTFTVGEKASLIIEAGKNLTINGTLDIGEGAKLIMKGSDSGLSAGKNGMLILETGAKMNIEKLGWTYIDDSNEPPSLTASKNSVKITFTEEYTGREFKNLTIAGDGTLEISGSFLYLPKSDDHVITVNTAVDGDFVLGTFSGLTQDQKIIISGEGSYSGTITHAVFTKWPTATVDVIGSFDNIKAVSGQAVTISAKSFGISGSLAVGFEAASISGGTSNVKVGDLSVYDGELVLKGNVEVAGSLTVNQDATISLSDDAALSVSTGATINGGDVVNYMGIVASRVSGADTLYYKSLATAVSVAFTGETITILKSVDCVASLYSKSLKFTNEENIVHTKVSGTAVPATCTQDGHTAGSLCACGKETTPQQIIHATGHTWNTGTVTKEATCTEAGITTFKCTKCGETETESIAIIAHTLVVVPAVEATCTEAGNNEYYTCSVCNKVFKADQTTQTTVEAEVIAALGHELEKTDAVAPTCTEAGNNEYYTCSVCGAVFKADQTTSTTVEAETIVAEGHKLVKADAVAATCTEAGNNEYNTCSVCGAVFKADQTTSTTVEDETIAAKGHTSEVIPAVAATCTETGLTEGSKCSVCGEILVKQGTVPAKGHSWDSGVITTQPTGTSEGVRTYTCTACGETLTETIPMLDCDHSWDSGKVTTEATCTSAGTMTYTCSKCGSTRTESIPMTEHSWDTGVVTTEATCTSQGVKTYTCSTCNLTKTEAIPMTDHSWNTGEITTEATCGTDGVMTYTCSTCGLTKTEAIPASGSHSWDSGTVVKEPTETESGVTEYKCTVCGQTKTATIEPKKTETTEQDGVKTTTETSKVVETSDDGTQTSTETTTVSKEENGKVTEKTETTKSITEGKDGSTTEAETVVTEKDGQVTEKVETTKTTTQTEDTTTVTETKVTEKAGEATEKVETVKSTTQKSGSTLVAETTVTEKGQTKTENTVVSVQSDDGSVKTDVSVSDGTTSGITTVISGEVTEDAIASAVQQADMAHEAISDKVADVEKNISVPTDNVTLSPTSLSALADSGASLTITGDAGSIGIDSGVTGMMLSRNEDVTISISEKKTGLTDEQKQKAGENKVIELSARSATEDIHELGGKAKVMIDMTGMDFRSPAVYWLKDDGSSERVDAEFGDGYAAIELDHFSLYYIAETAKDSEDSTVMYVAIAVLIILILAIAGYAMYRKKTA